MIFQVSFVLVVAVVTTVAASRKKHSSLVQHEKNGSNCTRGREEEEEEEEAPSDILKDREMEEKTLESNSDGNEEFDVFAKENEAEVVRYLAKEFKQREVALERRSLELDGLKKKEGYVAHLQKKLQEKTEEYARLDVTVSSMRAESVGLRDEINEGLIAEKQLQMSNEVIGNLQRKMDANASRVKGQLAMLREQVLGIEIRGSRSVGVEVDEKVKGSKRVEMEIFKVRRENKELGLERRELVVKLVAVKARLAAISKFTEKDFIAEAREEMSNLKQANEEILKQIEELQKSRFVMVEELVYQRWLNTCLRLQLQDYRNPIRPSTIKPNRESKTKLLIARTGSSLSSATSLTPSSISTNASSFGTVTSTSSSQRSNSKKPGLIRSIKKWGRSKDKYSADTVPSPSTGSPWRKSGLVRRFSASMVRSKPAPMQSDETCTNSPRIRRVSFDDHVRIVTLDFKEEPSTPAESESSGDDHSLEEKIIAKSPIECPDTSSENETILGNHIGRGCNANAELEKDKIEGVSEQGGDLDKVKIHSTVHFMSFLFLVLFLLLLVRFLLAPFL